MISISHVIGLGEERLTHSAPDAQPNTKPSITSCANANCILNRGEHCTTPSRPCTPTENAPLTTLDLWGNPRPSNRPQRTPQSSQRSTPTSHRPGVSERNTTNTNRLLTAARGNHTLRKGVETVRDEPRMSPPFWHPPRSLLALLDIPWSYCENP